MTQLNWSRPTQAALKILGDKGKVPDVPGAIGKSAKNFDTSMAAFQKSLADLQGKILTIANANDEQMEAVSDFAGTIAKDNLGLDPKNKEDAAKIAKARKVLSEPLQEMIRDLEARIRKLEELDKYVVEMDARYSKP